MPLVEGREPHIFTGMMIVQRNWDLGSCVGQKKAKDHAQCPLGTRGAPRAPVDKDGPSLGGALVEGMK